MVIPVSPDNNKRMTREADDDEVFVRACMQQDVRRDKDCVCVYIRVYVTTFTRTDEFCTPLQSVTQTPE